MYTTYIDMRKYKLVFFKLYRFMIECGYKPGKNCQWFLKRVFNGKWTEDDRTFALYLVNHGAHIDFIPSRRNTKENFKYLLRIDRECKFEF